MEPKQVNTYTSDEVKKLTYIGFCQPKFYKPSVWVKAKKLMLLACEMDIGVYHRPYRGAGHFWTLDGVSIESVVEQLTKKLVVNEDKGHDEHLQDEMKNIALSASKDASLEDAVRAVSKSAKLKIV